MLQSTTVVTSSHALQTLLVLHRSLGLVVEALDEGSVH